MFLLLLLLPLLLLLLLLLLLRMPLEWFPEVPSGCQRLPEASRDQRFPDWILIRKVSFLGLAGWWRLLLRSFTVTWWETFFYHFYAFLWDCRVFTASLVAPLAFSTEYGLSLNRKIPASFPSQLGWPSLEPCQQSVCFMEYGRTLPSH